MKRSQLKTIIRTYSPLYAMTGAICLVMNHFCRTDDSDALTWILTPTARWVSVLSGISFEYLPQQGYINHFYRFLIAPSCSGSRFMLLAFLMLVLSFPPSASKCTDRKYVQRKYLWFGLSIAAAYASTIFVNGIRIVISIYLPGILENTGLMGGRLTPDSLHTLIGTASYFTFLCVLYLLAALVHRRIFLLPAAVPSTPLTSGISARFAGNGRLLVPAFWYLLIVLALPLIKRMYHGKMEGFGQYAAVIFLGCLSIYGIFSVIGWVKCHHNKAVTKHR